MYGVLMKDTYEGFRILLVHAHPDDETINNGATMALYAARGAQVTLVTFLSLVCRIWQARTMTPLDPTERSNWPMR
jgi:hypothetical protein